MADMSGVNSPTEKDILLEEYKLHRTELQARFTHSVSLIGFMIGGLLAFFGLAVKEELTPLVVLTPWLSGILIGYLAGHDMVLLLSVAYLRDLEGRLEFIDYERCVTKEKWFRPPLLKNPFKIVGATLFIFCIGIYACFLWEAWEFASVEYARTTVICLVAAPTIFNVLFIPLSWWGVKYASELPKGRLYRSSSSEGKRRGA